LTLIRLVGAPLVGFTCGVFDLRFYAFLCPGRQLFPAFRKAAPRDSFDSEPSTPTQILRPAPQPAQLPNPPRLHYAEQGAGVVQWQHVSFPS
jgi:hypothetical protein